MSETVKITAKTPGSGGRSSFPKTKKPGLSKKDFSPANQILHLQRSMGNREVQRLLKSGAIQAKLKIGQPNDKYEQEADRVADQVMRKPESKGSLVNSHSSLVQRKSACPDCPDREEIQTKPLADQITPLVQRQMGPEEEEVQAKQSNNQAPGVTENIESGINSIRGGGQPLPESTRSFFEPRFGTDFSQVRVHTDSNAAGIARSVNAKAFTTGKDVVFDTGQYSPDTHTGKSLLAHELTHVLQQKTLGQPFQTKLAVSKSTNAAERHADDTADAVMFGIAKVPNSFSTTTSLIQRACGAAAIGAKGARPKCDYDGGPIFVSSYPFFKFNVGCDDFAPGEEANLRSTAATLPASGPVEVHGYSSVDGNATFNEHLSCARALKARTVLTKVGITPGRISVVKHGPTPGPPANRRSVVIRSSTPAPTPTPTQTPPATSLKVSFTRIQAASSPAGMPDRIPPRVDTNVSVRIVGFSIPMRPVTLSIDGAGGGNGTVTINGAATVDLTSSEVVQLRGVDQTAVGNAGNLRLVAEQGGKRLATSNNFSVSSIPQNHTITFECLIPDTCRSSTPDRRGFKVIHTWESDSTKLTDLDQIDISERVERDKDSGSLAGGTLKYSKYLGVGAGAKEIIDKHSIPANYGSGYKVIKQIYMFWDLRSGAKDIPVTNSGYKINHTIFWKPGFFFTDYGVITMKFGFGNTVHGLKSDAGSGSVVKFQDI